MARVTPIIHAFNAGEIGRLLHGRVDLDFYRASCRVMQNMIPLAQGAATRRPGTRYIAAVKTYAKRTALLRFQFSTLQSYTIELGDQYLRFYRNRGQILSGSPAAPHEIATPYLHADLFDAKGRLRIKYTQSADVMYLVHPLYAPRKLSRTGHTSWTLSVVDFLDGPYLDENTTATTLTPGAATGNGVTLTASSTTGINGGAGFQLTDVGRLVRLKEGSTWGWAKIVSRTSTTVVAIDIKSTLTNTNAKAAWMLGRWSVTTGWPNAVCFHENRLIFGQGQRFDGSKSNDFENFAPTTLGGQVEDDSAIAYAMASDEVNSIMWFASARDLLVGTLGAEARVGTDNTAAPMTPTNVNARQQTKHGCADMPPLAIGNAVLFVQRQGKRLRELAYRLDDDGYRAPDMMKRHPAVTRNREIVAMAFQQEPYPTVWCVTDTGELLSFSYERDEEVTAWARHPLGGNGVVEAVAVIAGDGADEVWMIVRRTIDGESVRYVELIEDYFGEDDDPADAFHVDSGLTYSGASTLSISGLAHLEGAEVAVWTDKGQHPRRTVESGAIALEFEVTKAQVGLPHTWILEPNRLEAGAQAGVAQGRIKRIDEVVVRLMRATGVKVGPEADLIDEISPRQATDAMGQAPALLDGDYPVPFNGTYDRDGIMRLQGDGPGPVTVICLMPRVATHEG